MCKISIIVPCYGVEKYLDHCMDRLVNQTLRDIEIILVDDVSPDRVPEMCDEWAKKDNRIKVVHKKKNEGLGLARNTGLEVASGEYIAFLDSDDFVSINMYETLYNKAKEQSFDVVYCNCYNYVDDNNIRPRKDVEKETIFIGREEVDKFLLDIIAPLPDYHHDVKYMMSVWHSIYKKEIFDKKAVKFVSERELVSEDLIFDIDYLQHVESICYLPDCLHYYRLNMDSLSHSFDSGKYQRQKDFALAVKSRLSKLFDEDKYLLHYQRSQFLLLRGTVGRLITEGASSKNIKDAIDDSLYAELLANYPYGKMDLKHRAVFFLLKHKFISLLRMLLNEKSELLGQRLKI